MSESRYIRLALDIDTKHPKEHKGYYASISPLHIQQAILLQNARRTSSKVCIYILKMNKSIKIIIVQSNR